MNEKDIETSEQKEFKRKQRKLMWFVGVTVLLIFMFLITYFVAQEAYAQSFFEIIENPDSCERIRIFGEKAWLPFTLTITHPPTDQTVSHVSAVDKEKEERDVTSNEGSFRFTTNEANTWTIGYQITYGLVDEIDPSGLSKERTYTIAYASEQKPTQTETRKMFGNQICHIFEITTEEAPEFPVIDDLLTDVGVKSLQEMQFVVPAINTLDQTLGRNTFTIAIFIVVVLGLIIFMYFKAKEFGETRLQTQRQILQATKNSTDQTEESKKAVTYMYDMVPVFENRIEGMINKFDIEKNTILLDIKKSLKIKTEKLPEKKVLDVKAETLEEIIEKIPIRKDFTKEELAQFESDAQAMEQMEKDKETTFANMYDVENPGKIKEPKTLKEKITKPIKQVIEFTISQATELPPKFKKSQPIFMGKNKDKVQIDYSEDQQIKPIKLKKLYMGNDNKVNNALYRKYWKLSQIYPNIDELSKRRDILHKILQDFAKSHEKRRQAEADVISKNGEEKNGRS